MESILYYDKQIHIKQRDIQIHEYKQLIEVNANYTVQSTDFISMPPLVVSLMCESYFYPTNLNDATYLVNVEFFGKLRNTQKLTNRITILGLNFNNIESGTSSHSYIENRKSRFSLQAPKELLRLRLARNPIFRLRLVSSVRDFKTLFCFKLCDVILREGIIRISTFLTHKRKPRNRQKTNRAFFLCVKGQEFMYYAIYIPLRCTSTFNKAFEYDQKGMKFYIPGITSQ